MLPTERRPKKSGGPFLARCTSEKENAYSFDSLRHRHTHPVNNCGLFAPFRYRKWDETTSSGIASTLDDPVLLDFLCHGLTSCLGEFVAVSGQICYRLLGDPMAACADGILRLFCHAFRHNAVLR